jgi:hypothetical protein
MRIVQGLLAKAQSTDQPDEADAFLAKAHQLMAQHAIDEAMLADAASGDRAEATSVTVICEAPYATAKAVLISGIAEANGCKAIRTTSGANQTMILFGFATDLAHVQALYTHLSLQATRAVLAQPVTTRRFRHAFLLGFASRVIARLNQTRAQAQADYEQHHPTGRDTARSVAVVLAGRRRDVDQAVAEQFPKTHKSRAAGSSVHGNAAGTLAGNRADLGHDRLGGPSRGAIDRR